MTETSTESSKKSAKVAKKAAAKPVAAKAAELRKAAPKSQSRKAAKPALLAGGNPQIAKGDGDAPTSDAASTRSSCAPSPACARQSNGTRRYTESKARAGSSASTASRSTSRWLSSAARRCILSPR